MKVYKDKDGNVKIEIEFDLLNGDKRLSYDRIMKVVEYVEDMMKKNLNEKD